jgi:MFS family permease
MSRAVPSPVAAPPSTAAVKPHSWLAAVAVVPILATVYQTLVLTDVTGDVIRKGIDGDKYEMIWTSVCWGVTVVYGVFAGIWAMARYGGRDTLQVGLIWFAMGNLLCGAAVDIPTLAVAKLVEGVGKGMVIVICRSLLYRQFDRMVIVAIGFYGIVAYATRPTTPLLTAVVNDALSWRWIFWINVPLTLLAFPLVRRFVQPDRPPRPLPLRIDWIAVTLFVAWVVTIVFTFGWYRKWGGWTSNAFTATAVLALLLPVVLAVWVGAGLPLSEHFRRMFRVRIYVLEILTRTLMLLQLLAVLTVMATYCIELRDYPRDLTGWILAPATVTMATSTLLTTYFRRRSLRHFWLLIGVAGCAGCLWWMSSVDNFTSKGQIALMIGCWGLFVGLFPPAFLQDEVEGIDRRDALYGGALAIVALVVPIVIVPTMTSTIISAFTDAALDSERHNLSRHRPAVDEAAANVADYFMQRGATGPELKQHTSTVLGSFVVVESAAQGIRQGLRFLSLIVGCMGLIIVLLLVTTAGTPLSTIPDH